MATSTLSSLRIPLYITGFAFIFYLLVSNKSFADNTSNPHNELPEGVLLGQPFNLDPNVPPGKNFDLLDWYLTLPIDSDKNGNADRVMEPILDRGFEFKPLFYTASDGGMVFASPNYGATTSKNTKYVRTELREMLRRGNMRIKGQGVNKNNWVFGNMHFSGQKKAAAVGGSLEATLKVDRVSTTGDIKKVGRVIIGQIHAIKDEPIRLYYRKLPQNNKGTIYFAHEINGADDEWHSIIGTRSHTSASPEDGIALGEMFSYKISVEVDQLYVTLIREGKSNITRHVDMSESGYHLSNQYMYFKAGVYNQNNTGAENDYVQATFYHLHNTHDGYEK